MTATTTAKTKPFEGHQDSRARSAARAFRRDFSITVVTGCAPPSTRRAVRVVSSSVSLRPHGDRQAWPRRRCRVVTGGASSISRLSSALRDDTTVVATAARAPTASATRSSSSSSPRARLSTATAHTGSEASCALFDRFVRARAGVATLRTHWQCCPVFWATRPPFATRAATIRCGWLLRARPHRFRPLVNK